MEDAAQMTAAQTRYNHSPRGKARNAAYARGPKNRARVAAYRASPEGKTIREAWHKNRYETLYVGFFPRPLNSLCGNCHKKTVKLYGDHDHTTNHFRGWLCFACNTGIGKLGDKVEGLIKAINYLERAQCRTISQSRLNF